MVPGSDVHSGASEPVSGGAEVRSASSRAEPRERESVLGVLGLACGFALIAAAAGMLSMLSREDRPLDGAALLRERFERAGPFPFELALAGAEYDTRRREVVRLESPAAEPIPSAAEARLAEAPPVDAAAPAEPPPPIEWDELPVLREDGPPTRAAFVWYPRANAQEVLDAQFTQLRFEAGEMGGMGGGPGGRPGGGRGGRSGGGGGGHGAGMPGGPPGEPTAPDPKLQDAGNLSWSGYAAPFVRLREFALEGGRPSFRETVRVNLTVGEWCCVLYLRWPEGEAGSRERVREFLAALEPKA